MTQEQFLNCEADCCSTQCSILAIPSIVREFVAALERKTLDIKEMKITGLERLRAQFRFEQLPEKLSKFVHLLHCEMHKVFSE
jgi:hypothetical protein